MALLVAVTTLREEFLLAGLQRVLIALKNIKKYILQKQLHGTIFVNNHYPLCGSAIPSLLPQRKTQIFLSKLLANKKTAAIIYTKIYYFLCKYAEEKFG